MNKSTIFTKAHVMAKKIIKHGDDYRITFGECVRFIFKNGNKMNGITLSNGAVITSDCEFKKIRGLTKVVISVTHESNSFEKAVRLSRIDNAQRANDWSEFCKKYSFLDMSLTSADLLQIKDYLLKRKLHIFMSYDELNAHDESHPNFGEIFTKFDDVEPLVSLSSDAKGAVYEYEKPYNESIIFAQLEKERAVKEAKKEEKKEKRAKKVKNAREANKMIGLPKLTGSTKQKQWAEQIRTEYFLVTSEKDIDPEALTENASRYWIDNHKDIFKIRKGWTW